MSKLPLGAGFAVLSLPLGAGFAALWLPLGGKLLAKRGDEGQSIYRQLVFNPKEATFSKPPSLSPSGVLAELPLKGKLGK